MTDGGPDGQAKTCPRCGAGFGCAVSGKCWCAEEPYRMPLPKSGVAEYPDCLCATCLREIAAGCGLAPEQR